MIYTDPTGHHVCDDEGNCYDQRIFNARKPVTRVNPTKTLSEWELKLIALAVFSETSEGKYPDDAMTLIAWVFLNRKIQNPNMDLLDIIRDGGATLDIEKAFAGENPEEKIKNAISCYESSSACPIRSPSYMHILEDIVKPIYESYLSGGKDPTNGGTQFSVQRTDIRREDEHGRNHIFNGDPWGLRHYLDTSYRNHPGITYTLSIPFSHPDRDGNPGVWLIVSVSSHVCGSVGNCGSIGGYGPKRP